MIEIRATSVDERRAAAAAFMAALLNPPPTDEDWERGAPSWDDMDSVSAWEDDRCVGHGGGFRFDTVVPGGERLATCGVTRVGVLTTHRRRGVLTSLMTKLLVDGRAKGQVLASLRASETVIYGRYGYGVAGDACSIELRPKQGRPITGAADGTMRLLQGKEILEIVPSIYDRSMSRVGMITRPDWMWERYFRDAISDGGTASFVAVHTGTDGRDDGFVHYDPKWKEEVGTYETGIGTVFDVCGESAGIELALWRYLGDVDLVESWRSDERPVDDLVRSALADSRGYRTGLRYDEQWLRLLDVDRALTARTYADVAPAVTIAVTDPLFADNTGRWRVTRDGASRTDGDGDGDLVAGIAEISATYLGGTSWRTLVDVGRVTETQAGAAADADALFGVHPAPFCGSHF